MTDPTPAREVWDTFAASASKQLPKVDAGRTFEWTQYPGHGPSEAVLGRPRTTLELGFGTGNNVAFLAQQGVQADGVDLSPVQCGQTQARWGGVRGARFFEAEAVAFLTKSEERWDAIYSVFGAAWFTDPHVLLPLVRARLAPGGVLAFSHPPAIPGCYGPQGMYKGGFAGRPTYLRRYCYTPQMWTDMLTRVGFTDAHAEVLEAPDPAHIGTLMIWAELR